MLCHPPGATLVPTQDNSHWVSGQGPLEGFDGNGVLEVLALVKVVALCVLQVPVEGELVSLDLSDVFSFTNVDLLQACSHHVPEGNKGYVRQGMGGKDTVHRVRWCDIDLRSISRMTLFSSLFIQSILLSIHSLSM